MKVSVLICTYNRAALLDQALESLIETSTERPDEIAVVVGGEDEETELILRKWHDHYDALKWKKIKNIVLANSRNVGLTLCTSDIIAITDDDARVFPDWITQIKRSHEKHPEAGAIGGMVLAVDDHRFINRIANYTIFPTPVEEGYVRTVPGVNCSYKRHAIEKVGAYDETLFRGEDVDFNWQLKQKGYEIYHDPAIGVYHFHRTTWRGLVKQIYMYGRAYLLVRKKWPDMYCIYPHRLKSFHDILKLGYFLFGMFLEPFAWIKYQKKATDIVVGYPIGVLLAVIWRYGMLVQWAIEKKTKVFMRRTKNE